MTAQTLRRYLQPSAELRWHPWAPIAALVLALGFAFVFGAQWGLHAGRKSMDDVQFSQGFLARMRLQHELAGDPRGVVNDAHAMDAMVERWLRMRDARPSWIEGQVRRLEFFLMHGWLPPRYDGRPDHGPGVKAIAEFRLKELSGDAPAWRVTAKYCEHDSRTPSAQDITERYTRTAEAYSKLLGRPITAAQLAPAVPGGECKGWL